MLCLASKSLPYVSSEMYEMRLSMTPTVYSHSVSSVGVLASTFVRMMDTTVSPAAMTASSPGQKLLVANDHVADARAKTPAAYLSVLFMMIHGYWKVGIGATWSSSDPRLSLLLASSFPLSLSVGQCRDCEDEGCESGEEGSEGFQQVIHVSPPLSVLLYLNHTR